jgi:hypothetical protein
MLQATLTNMDHPAIIAAKDAALARATKYGITPMKYTKQLGFCWLVAGGPKKQWYRSEARIIHDYERKQTLQQLADSDVELVLA